jgi:hypothetical protein
VTPALGLVVGEDAETLLPDQIKESIFGWGYAGIPFASTNETSWRNYLVTTAVRHYNLTQGKGFWSRHYFVLGDDLADLSTRIADRQLVDAELRPFNYTEANTPLVAYSVSGSGSSFQCLESQKSGGSASFFLYAHPVTGSFPVFEILEDDASRYLTWNPYANGIIKPYDGTLAGMRLLGFAMPSAGTNGTVAALSGFLPAENYMADGETLFARTATPIETWRVEHFGLTDNAGDGADTADVEPDGLDNLLEYALGGNPTNDDASAVAPDYSIAAEGGSNWLYYVHNERIDDPSLNYIIGTATNLVSVSSWNTNDVVVVGESASIDRIKSVTNRTEVIGGSKFIRLNIEKQQ